MDALYIALLKVRVARIAAARCKTAAGRAAALAVAQSALKEAGRG